MNQRTTSVYPVLFAMAMAVCVALSAQAQTEFRTEWGDPDLRGLWTNATVTPVERPAALGDKTHFTEEEAEAMKGTGLDAILNGVGRSIEGTLTGELSETWLEPGTEVVRSRRTSLIVDPPDGKIPYTPEGRMRYMQEQVKRIRRDGRIVRGPLPRRSMPEQRHYLLDQPVLRQPPPDLPDSRSRGHPQ